MDLGLKDKVVIVTGPNGGIGQSIVRAFIEEGAIVCAFYRGDESKLDGLRASLQNAGQPLDSLYPVEVDLSETTSIEAAVQNVVNRFGVVDVLINNAGWTVEKPFLSLKDDEWDEIVNVNLSSLGKLCRAVMRQMMAKKQGVVINISSVVGSRHGRGVAAYAACKSAVNRLTECLALEMGKKGIRVNSICPGVIDTPMSGAMIYRLEDMLMDKTPLRRFGKPDEVAKAALFLASEVASSFITGHKLTVDGGISL